MSRNRGQGRRHLGVQEAPQEQEQEQGAGQETGAVVDDQERPADCLS